MNHRSSFTGWFRLLVNLVVLFWASFLFPQAENHWIEIELTDTLNYAAVSQGRAGSPENLLSNVFDADCTTCWEAEPVFIRMPEDAAVLNIYSPCARSSKMIISVYGGINPDGYVTEKAVLYKALKYDDAQFAAVQNEGGLQSISLNFPKDALAAFLEECRSRFLCDFDKPTAGISLIMRVEFLEDICLSELFFNDRFMSCSGRKSPGKRDVYINEKENALLAESGSGETITLYRDTSAVLQLLEVSKDKKWAILISMPAGIQGRVETAYLLVDLTNGRMVNEQLAQATGNYLPGNEMFLEYDEKEGLLLNYISADNENVKIKLV